MDGPPGVSGWFGSGGENGSGDGSFDMYVRYLVGHEFPLRSGLCVGALRFRLGGASGVAAFVVRSSAVSSACSEAISSLAARSLCRRALSSHGW